MADLAIIGERMDDLRNLSCKTDIYLDDLREEFRQDLRSFIVGETLTSRNGKLVIGHTLYKQWLSKIRAKGFDNEIDFK